jgi:hypothetical protein
MIALLEGWIKVYRPYAVIATAPTFLMEIVP